ncbi:hypothetical protein KS4_00910 [Poriferisphaera corsica]|uniref:Asl1-like glycosyl hydrolase catalytic domain-containing protein n=1 Tax=Poriferisphaera corsica TaxID=2528020 RepID=A0A517YPD2_9BACT|nr:hypothetical protein [Poriferisphaera corsica]QDU32062.1 hypothetical protein KS4_00910 [Poriferisphaera corsica]
MQKNWSRVGREIVVLVIAYVSMMSTLYASEPLMKDFVGINGHTVLFKPEVYSPVSKLARDYHSFSWDVGNDSANATSFPFAQNGVNWESLYSKWNAQGIDSHVSIMFNHFQKASDWTNIAADAKAYGRAIAQYFGPTVGNGLIKTIEIGNEPHDMDDELYVKIFRNMAMGIREVDSNLKISTAAVGINPQSKYIKDIEIMKSVIDYVDIISVHTYPNLTRWPYYDVSHPEDDRMSYLENVRDVIDWRNNFAEGREVWVTEFGYDAPSSNASTPNGWEKWRGDVTERQQAQYLVRSYMAFAEMDVERAYMFWFDDDDKAMLHGSKGITRHGVPKESYWAMKQMQEKLGDYRFEGIIESDTDAYIYSFVSGENEHDKIWVMWSPTGDGLEIDLDVSLLGAQVEWVESMAYSQFGDWSSDFELLNDNIQIIVGESPVYVKLLVVPEPGVLIVILGIIGVLSMKRCRFTLA